MAKSKKDVTVKQLVDESVRSQLQESGVTTVGEEDSPIVQPENVPESLKPLLSSFPSSEGFYGKIFRIEDNGEWKPMPYRIEAPETIPDGDLEGEVRRVVVHNKWGNGNYRVQIKKTGDRGLYVNRKVIVDEIEYDKGNGGGNQLREQLGMFKDVVDIARSTQVSPESMGAQILKAVETGRSMSAQDKAGSPDIISIITALVPLITPLLNRPQLNENDIVDKVVAKLQPLMQPKEDNFAQLAKMKELFGMKFAHEIKPVDSLDSVKRVTDIMTAIKPFSGTASAEPPSTLSLILEHGPRILEPLFSTVKDFAESKKLEMQMRMEQWKGGGVSQVVPGPVAIGPGAPVALSAPRIHPFGIKLIEVAGKMDESYFDMMRQQIIRLYGAQTIQELIEGNITSDLVVETVNMELGVPVNTPNLKLYIEKFIAWLKEKDQSETLLAECTTCHEQYDFKKDEWEADTKICEECKGKLELVKREGQA